MDFSQEGRLLMPALFKVKKDTLHLCFPDGDERPQVFGTCNGSKQAVSTFRRVKS